MYRRILPAYPQLASLPQEAAGHRLNPNIVTLAWDSACKWRGAPGSNGRAAAGPGATIVAFSHAAARIPTKTVAREGDAFAAPCLGARVVSETPMRRHGVSARRGRDFSWIKYQAGMDAGSRQQPLHPKANNLRAGCPGLPLVLEVSAAALSVPACADSAAPRLATGCARSHRLMHASHVYMPAAPRFLPFLTRKPTLPPSPLFFLKHRWLAIQLGSDFAWTAISGIGFGLMMVKTGFPILTSNAMCRVNKEGDFFKIVLYQTIYVLIFYFIIVLIFVRIILSVG